MFLYGGYRIAHVMRMGSKILELESVKWTLDSTFNLRSYVCPTIAVNDAWLTLPKPFFWVTALYQDLPRFVFVGFIIFWTMSGYSLFFILVPIVDIDEKPLIYPYYKCVNGKKLQFDVVFVQQYSTSTTCWYLQCATIPSETSRSHYIYFLKAPLPF